MTAWRKRSAIGALYDQAAYIDDGESFEALGANRGLDAA